jgi:hypothetical protein
MITNFSVLAEVQQAFRDAFANRLVFGTPPTSGFLVLNCTYEERDQFVKGLIDERRFVNTVQLSDGRTGVEVDRDGAFTHVLAPVKPFAFLP